MTCADCPAALGPRNKSGRCLPCGNRHRERDPAFQQRKREGIARKWASDPAFAERRRKSMQAISKAHWSDPAYVDRRRAHGYRMVSVIASKQVLALAASPEVRRRAQAKREETLMGWCPAAYRAEYRRLVRSKRMPAAEARAIIDAQIRADQPKPGSFEYQLARVAAGASIIAKPVLPTTVHSFTLGGVSAGML